MKAAVQTWLSILRTSVSTRGAYWRMLPLRSLRKLLVAAFITGCGIGFVIDLFLLNIGRSVWASSGRSTLARLEQPFLGLGSNRFVSSQFFN